MNRVNLNTQEPVKQDLREDGGLMVHSIFDTIQGEGPYAGVPAVFVRLADCNLQCPGCDTDYTSRRELVYPHSLVEQIMSFRKPNHNAGIGLQLTYFQSLVVITGGEPFLQNFAPLAKMLVYTGYRVQVETNGTLWADGFYPARFDVVCSPKAPKVHPEIQRYVRALKYVIQAGEIDPADGLPTSILENGLRPARPWPGYKGEIFVQPYDEGDVHMDPTGDAQRRNHDNYRAAMESALRFGYRLGVQVHKIVGVP